MNHYFAHFDMFPAQKMQNIKKLGFKRSSPPAWFSLFTPIMDAKDDREGGCRQQLFAQLSLVLKDKKYSKKALKDFHFLGERLEHFHFLPKD